MAERERGWTHYDGQEYDKGKYRVVEAWRNIFCEEDPEDAVYFLQQYLAPIENPQEG